MGIKSVLLLTLLSLLFVNGERTKEKIYVNIDGWSSCFRRMNGTHQIGCTSDPKGNVGVVHYVDKKEDLDWLINSGQHGPYSALLKPADFNRETIHRLRQSGKVNGIMVIHLPLKQDLYPIPDTFSPDSTCPNEGYGLYGDSNYTGCSSVTWNPEGNGLMFDDFDIPIFVLTNESSINFIIEHCYKKFNKPQTSSSTPQQYPLCAVQLKDRMDGAKDSETCIRRNEYQPNLSPNSYCDPLGDKNVFATVKIPKSRDIKRPKKSVIVAAARLDSFSMFEDVYPSADNPVTSIVALLAAAEAIGKVKDSIRDSNTTKDIMFTFFQGEAFDYIGSDRMVHEMKQDNFPENQDKYNLQEINLSHISHFVEVNQLAYRDQGKVWIHTDPVTREHVEPEVSDMVEKLKGLGESLIDEANKTLPLPPASVQSFLKNNKDPFPAVVITDHEKGFTNKYYNSRFDLPSAIKMGYTGKSSNWYDQVTDQARNLTEVATVLAKFLYNLATSDNATDVITVNETTVTHLLYCFLISPKCELFQDIINNTNADILTDSPFPFYVGVERIDNKVSQMTRQLLLYYLGDVLVNTTVNNCTGNNKYFYWMQGPKDSSGSRDHPLCVAGPAFYSTAVSIAFENKDYDWKSHKHSTWTESSWAGTAIDVRVFLIPSPHLEVTTLIVGILILLVSLVGGYFVNKRASVLFDLNNSDSSQAAVSL